MRIIDKFITLIVVIISRVNVFVKINQIVCFKYVQFIIYQSIS